MQIRKPALLLLLFLTGSIVFSQNPSKPDTVFKFSLEQAVQFALENNYSVKNSAIDYEVARKKVWETTAIGLPQVTATGQYTNIFKVPVINFGETYLKNTIPDDQPLTAELIRENLDIDTKAGPTIPLGVKENTQVTFLVTQLIFSGEYIVGLQSANIYKLSKQQLYEKTVIDTKEQINNTYHLILVLEESKRISDTILSNIIRTEFEINESLKAGFVEETDLDQIALTRSQLENAARQIERQIAVAYKLLNFQLGIDLGSKVNLTQNLNDLLLRVDPGILAGQELNLQNNLDYQMISTQEDLNKLLLKLEKWRFLPSLSGYYQRLERAKKPDFDFMSPDMIGLSLNFTLFTSGSRISKMNQARLNLEMAKNLKTQVTDGILLELEQNRTAYTIALDSYTVEKKNVDIAQNIYNRSLIKYREGLLSSLELTSANNQFLTAQSNYFSGILNLLNAKVKLNKTLNQL